MPLLNRKPFSSDPPPSDLSENEEIFVCRQTNEVYRDYESFFKRTILCNSLVWSCEVTLKHSLTYEEALDSEQEAQKVVDHVSIPIQQGVLTLVHYTRHSRLDNLCDEVYNYIRDRYQEGEEVEVKHKGEKCLGYIHKVIEPTSLINGFGSSTSSPKSKQTATKKSSSPHIKNKSGKSNLSSPNKPGGSIIVLSDDENQSNNKEKMPPLPSPSSPKASSTWPDSKRYQYEVRLKNIKNASTKTPETITAKYSDISRKKRTFSRDKLKLLLRVTCCRTTPLTDDGYWRVKDEYRQKFDLSPDVDLMFQNMPVKKKNKKRKSDDLGKMNGKSDSKKRKKSEEKDKMKKTEGKEDKSKKDKNKKEKMLKKMSPEEIEKYKLEMKILQEKKKEERKHEKEVQRELKKKEREKERQEKRELLREQRLSLLHWCIPQEDLDLDDLKELPTPVPVQCKFSGEMFGSIVMVLEFLHTFGEFFEMKQDFPDGVSMGMLEEALQEHDAEGIFYDILKFLLQCILKTHAEEEEEEGLDDSDVQAHDETEDRKMKEEDEEESDLARLKKAVSSSASMAAAWAQLHQGKNLHELILDPFTCSEILRLHILSSGARLVSGTDGDHTYRWQRRGGFTFADDAGVAFRHREHGIMRALVTNNVYDLDTIDKLKILSTLCSQLLTYVTTRDIIDDGFDRLKKAKRELQEEQWADQRKDKEEAAAKYRKRMEEKAKEREEKEKKLTESKSETPEDSKEKVPNQDSSIQEDERTLKQEEENLSKAITRSQAPPVAEEEMQVNDETQEQREREERKELLKKKEKSFLKEIRKGQAMSGLQPIGIDRGFRRYWLFSSINGLFIEDNDSELDELLQPKVNDELSEEDGSDGDSSVSENLGENSLEDVPGDIEPLSNPKEASNKPPLNSFCSLTKKQIQEEKELSRILKLYSIPLESLPENSPLSSQGELGEKREENCEKLITRNIAQWSYLDKKEDFDKLIETLNPRGIREKSLREALLQHYKTIVNGLNDNPVRVENRERNEALQQQISARNKRADLRNQTQGVNKTLYKNMEDFIEANLRDQILDVEDRIWQGGLGSVKNEDITAWRKKVENGIYDFKPAATPTETANEDSNASVNGMDVEGQESETMEVDEKKEANSIVRGQSLLTCKLNILPCFENSRPGTPVDGSFASTPTASHTPQAINPCVRMLAKAVLEVEQGIERKYLIPPLGDDEEKKKRKQQEASEAARMEFDEMMATSAGKKRKEKIAKNDVAEAEKQENGNSDVSPKTEQVAKQQKTLLERWEDSLMASTNLSQVFIHLTNLDNCISWNKSVLNARCRICRRKGDAEHMLLCDGCDRGHHMYCLKPPIKEIPEGDWFCSACRPKEPRRSFRKTRKVEESDEESGDEDKTGVKREEVEESNSDEGEDDDSSEDEEEDSVEESDDDEEEEEEDEKMDEVEGSDEEGSVHMETCACCDGGGELLCCETCPLAYHLECAYPPLRRVPRGSWACQVCTGADSELPAGRRIKKSVIKTAQKRVNEKGIIAKTGKTSTKEIVPKKVVKTPTTSQPKPKLKSDTPPAVADNRKTSAAVRINKRKIATPPQVSSTPRGQFNSAPKRTANPKWPGQVKTCRKLLKELTEHEDSWPFLHPVDGTEVPDYSTIVKTPMDLKTIDGKLSSRQYHSVEDFAADIRQIFFNCAEYNKPRTREARVGVRLSALFETRFGELGLDASDNRPTRARRSR